MSVARPGIYHPQYHHASLLNSVMEWFHYLFGVLIYSKVVFLLYHALKFLGELSAGHNQAHPQVKRPKVAKVK